MGGREVGGAQRCEGGVEGGTQGSEVGGYLGEGTWGSWGVEGTLEGDRR